MIEIEKNIPIARLKTGPGRPPIYPFEDMQIGDSFFWPVQPGQSISQVQQSISNCARYRGYVIKTRSAEKDDRLGIRVWLMA